MGIIPDSAMAGFKVEKKVMARFYSTSSYKIIKVIEMANVEVNICCLWWNDWNKQNQITKNYF